MGAKMDQLTPSHYLVAIGIFSIILEIILGAATGFELLVLGVIFIISGSLGIYTGSLSAAIASTAVFAGLYIAFGRRIVQNRFNTPTRATNIDAVIGARAVVTKEITPRAPGMVAVEGEVWRAAAEEHCKVGDTVVVRSVSGVTLTVAKV